MSDLQQPDKSSELEAEGIPDLEGSAPGMTIDDEVEGLIPPRDHPQGVDEFGTTADEERANEPLSLRVLREEPDPLAEELSLGDAPAEQVGRLVQPGDEIDELDTTAEEVAFDSGDDAALTAEEAAMHITDAPPMGDGDGYLEEEDA